FHKARVVSLFSGCGGFDLGLLGGFSVYGEYFHNLPFELVHAYDFNAEAIETYRLNIGPEASVVDLTDVEMQALPSADILTGGFPCQDFSSCGPKTGFEGKRGKLYTVMVDYMRTHQPMMVIGENVPHLAKLSGGALLKKIVDDFEAEGYTFKVWTMYCPDYGLPQNRTRLIFVGVRNDIAKTLGMPLPPQPNFFAGHRTIDDAIDDLIKINDETVTNQSQYFVATVATAGAGQGDQKNLPGEIAYAMRANPKARIHFHHRLERRLTVRECARLQSFPDEFVFPFSASTNVMQVGNAVPPIIGHAVGYEIAQYFQKATELVSRIGTGQ
ncbi:MAG: DNA cytosine methyltransferase, partial [Pirellula sp.]